MNLSRGSAFLLCLLALSACAASVHVANDYDPQVTLTNYQHWAWHPKEEPLPPNAYVSELVMDRIERAVEDQLALQGKDKVDAAKADFFVRTHLVVEDKLDVQDWDMSYGFYHRPFLWDARHDITVTPYKQGTLIVDLVDAKTGKLFWRGTGESRINPEQAPADREKRVREVVRAVLAQYPRP